MAILLNRKYGSRLECLYYILKSCYSKFGTQNSFSLNDLKYDNEDENNVHKFCNLLINCIGIKCCPFLVNPLNSSKCYATQSKESDSTKSKAVSDIGGSLAALGFITRCGNKYTINKIGEEWIKQDFESKKWVEIALQAVLSYGPIVGLLAKLIEKDDKFSCSGLYLSYPRTIEKVMYEDESNNLREINISTDSQKDSNTRTMSRLLAWCVTVGLLEPETTKLQESDLPHIKFRGFINKGELTVRTFYKTDVCKNFFNKKKYVANPLSYDRLHKNVASLRENGGEELRLMTMKYNGNILSRRFVFVYVLNYFSRKNMKVSFELLVNEMIKYSKYFFIDVENAYEIMSTESEIADIAGIPFVVEDNMMIPLTIINEDVLKENAPVEIVSIANEIIKNMESL